MSQYSKEFLLLFAKYRELTLKEYLDDNEAFKVLEKSIAKDLLKQLKAEIAKNEAMGSDGFKAILAELPNIVAINKTENEPTTTEEKEERTVQSELQKKVEIKRENKADYEQLVKYIDAGFQLYPCVAFTDSKGTKYGPITLSGKYKLYETEEQKQKKDRRGITDKELLWKLCTQKQRILSEKKIKHAIELFRIYPQDNKYLVIDIDTHKGKANGLVQWSHYIRRKGLGGYYKDLSKFPCYVESANGGKHLYFRVPYELPSKIKNIASSVEVSTKDHPETAGGSYRKGTKNSFYELRGRLEDAPILPLCILEDIEPPPEKPAVVVTSNDSNTIGKAKWNKTTKGLIEMAKKKNVGGPHDFITLVCFYAITANKNDGTHYTKKQIGDALLELEEVKAHEQKDKGDLKGVLNSYFDCKEEKKADKNDK